MVGNAWTPISEYLGQCDLKYFFLSFLLLTLIPLKAQYNLDSAVNVLQSDLSFEERFQTYDFLISGGKDPIQVIEYGLIMLEMIENKDSLSAELRINNSLGFAYKQLGNYTKACEYFYENAEIANSNNLSKEESYALGNLGTTYNVVGDYEKAGALLNQSLKISYALEDSSSIHPGLINLGNIYYYKGSYDSSLYYLSESIKYAEGDQYEDYYNAYSKGTASLALAKLDRLDSAETLLQESIFVWEKYLDYYPVAECLIEIANTYQKVGMQDKALTYLREGFRLARENGFQQFERDASLKLFQIFKATEQLDSALFYQSAYYLAKDSIQNIEAVKKVETERANFEISKKQNEVDLLESQKQSREQFLIGLAIIILILLVGAILIYRGYQLQQRLTRELSQQKKQLELLNASKDKLFSILSHDLRGPIAAFAGVSQMIKIAVKNKKVEMLDDIANEVKTSSTKLSSMLENLLSWAIKEQGDFKPNPEIISVTEMADELLGMYTSVASSKDILLSADMPGEAKVYADRNATLTIFRNLINNALKFTPSGGEISFSASQSNKNIDFEVRDTGVGISKDKIDSIFTFQSNKPSFGTAGEKGLGLGLSLVQEFVYSNNGELSVMSEEGKGTTFLVKLPSA